MSTAKTFLRFAGSNLGGYLDKALGIGGKVGQAAATSALNYGVGKFAPQLAGKTGKEIPALLRTSPTSPIPQLGKLVGQGAVVGTGLAAANMLDQQSEYSQPMSSGVGTADLQKFMMSQELQNQKFMHDMMLIQNRAESRIPGAQYPGSLYDMARAEKEITDAGEITNREVQGIGRMIYGTGLRA
jgi:hypothetical protein